MTQKDPSGLSEKHPKPDAAEIADWIEAIARNADRSAFEKLFAYFAPRLKSYLLKQTHDDSMAEELMQETLILAWRKAALYDRRQAAPSTWIFTIARNKRIDHMRQERRPELDPHDPIWQATNLAMPDEAFDALQEEELLRTAIKNLPAEQRELIDLVYYQDQSHRDIAARRGIPLGTVKSRIRLALARLKKNLTQSD